MHVWCFGNYFKILFLFVFDFIGCTCPGTCLHMSHICPGCPNVGLTDLFCGDTGHTQIQLNLVSHLSLVSKSSAYCISVQVGIPCIISMHVAVMQGIICVTSNVLVLFDQAMEKGSCNKPKTMLASQMTSKV